MKAKLLLALVLGLVRCASSTFDGDLKVCAFNIQVFGVSKMGKPLAISTLPKLISRWVFSSPLPPIVVTAGLKHHYIRGCALHGVECSLPGGLWCDMLTSSPFLFFGVCFSLCPPRCHMVAVQEVRDASDTAVDSLLELVNTGRTEGEEYAVIESERFGSSNSKESCEHNFLSSRPRVPLPLFGLRIPAPPPPTPSAVQSTMPVR